MLQPGRDVDAFTIDVVAFDHHVADVQPDPELHAPVTIERPVACRQLALYFDSALQRFNDAWEFC